MIFALVLLYQATTANVANPPAADVAQAQTGAQTPAASGVAAPKKPSEKPAVVCRKEFPTGTRVRTVTVCTTDKSMQDSQADFTRSLSASSLAPRP